jgi:hypothetical protein
MRNGHNGGCFLTARFGCDSPNVSLKAYVRLSSISVAHLYRLRNSSAYRKRNTSYQPTRPTPIPIGARRKPQPRGEPGFLRIDIVHQGDQQGRKGLYHINAVDEVTQWEIAAAAPQISELWLIPESTLQFIHSVLVREWWFEAPR